MMESEQIRVGLIGYGHWGPNHLRVFHSLPQSKVVMCAEIDPVRRSALEQMYPDVRVTSDPAVVWGSSEIDAVVISTPTRTHAELTRGSLEAGKHVLCEKPLALSVQECEQLGTLADEKGLVLMVGHIFMFNPGIIKIKQLIRDGRLGRLQYAHSERTNLGPFRYDVNTLWDLAPHDVSIFNDLLDAVPINVSARGHSVLNKPREDLVFASLMYPNDVFVNIHVSWLDPKKERQITIVGDKRMAVWDDLDMIGPVKIYDKHVERTSLFYDNYGEFQLLSREGDITIPYIDIQEPLKVQNQYFLQCIARGQRPVLADARRAADVVRVLEAVQRSMDRYGTLVDV